VESKWRKRLLLLTIVLAVLLVCYSVFFRTFLDGDQYLAMALAATGNDKMIVNADEPDFAIVFHQGRPAIHFVFQTASPQGIGWISLYIDPIRKTYFDVTYEDPGKNLGG
jgi:hypothetical protein